MRSPNNRTSRKFLKRRVKVLLCRGLTLLTASAIIVFIVLSVTPGFLHYTVHVEVLAASDNESRRSDNYREDVAIVNDRQNGYVVPNIVHFIYFGNTKNLTFIQYLSILSASIVQKPRLLMLHCDVLPKGYWWERLWREVPLNIMYREAPKDVYGQPIRHAFHQSDVARLEILLEHGGIYLDTDVLVIQPLDALRRYDLSMGKEKTPKLISGIIVARKNALFLKIWQRSYRNNYWQYKWDYNSGIVAYKLYKERQDLVHVEPTRLTTPDWLERHRLYYDDINWRELYVLHLMFHKEKAKFDPEVLKTLRGIVGQVMRKIYYGSPEIIK